MKQKRRKTLHELLKFRLEEYKKEVDKDLARGLHNYDPGTAEHEIYLVDLGRYVETLLADISVNRGNNFSWVLMKYKFSNVEDYNNYWKVKEYMLTDDEWQALKTYKYYLEWEDSAL